MASASGSRESSNNRLVNRTLQLSDMSAEPVVIMYVENPERFYCRLKSDDQPFQSMMTEIDGHIQRPLDISRPLTVDDISSGQQLLVYSTIHQQWCRCRIQQIMSANTDRGVRVLVVDYGNVEVVSSLANLRQSTDEIIGANNGQSFCFECRLPKIKPRGDSPEWGPKAIQSFKDLIREFPMTLGTVEKDSSGVIIADLVFYDYNHTLRSTAQFLTDQRVVCYRVGEDFYHKLLPDDYEGADHETNGDFEWHSDNDDEEDDKYKDNKLMF